MHCLLMIMTVGSMKLLIEAFVLILVSFQTQAQYVKNVLRSGEVS